MHRGRALQDADLVPDDTVDLGEETQLDEMGTGEGLDLSFLWVVDARTLPPSSPPYSSASALAAEGKKRKNHSAKVTKKVKTIGFLKKHYTELLRHFLLLQGSIGCWCAAVVE